MLTTKKHLVKEMVDGLPTNSSLLLYQTEDGQTKIEVRLQDETVWLNQAQLCELFDKDKSTISEHIQNIFRERELIEESVVRKFRTTAADGKNSDRHILRRSHKFWTNWHRNCLVNDPINF